MRAATTALLYVAVTILLGACTFANWCYFLLCSIRRASMVSTRRQKQAVAAAALSDEGILKQIFEFLPGHHLFLSGVCREWRAVYAGTADQRVRNFSLYDNIKLVTCGTRTTLFSAAVASPTTARLACECGVQISTSENMQVIAGRYADIHTLATLRELGMPLSESVIQAVALSGRLDVLQYLIIEQQCIIPDELSYYAARSGSISMLNWLRAEEWCEFNQIACAGAAAAGQLAALKHLRNEGCDWNASTIAYDAAGGGSIEVVEWLRQQDIEFDAEAMSCAAGAGETAICKYLRSTGCEWDDRACTKAAKGGHLDTLRWLRESGCPWYVSEVFDEAVCFSYMDILDFILEQGEVLDAELLTNALAWAGAFNQRQAAQWLRQHGAAWPAVLRHAVVQWSGDTLAWARAEGCTSPTTL
jgi:hypothetical protein